MSDLTGEVFNSIMGQVMSASETRLPDILYHYTSVAAFKSIIATQKIRATRYDQMNDHGELQFGMMHLLQSLKLRRVDDADEQYMRFLVKGIESFVDAKLAVYILSLSAAADSLEQWRAYSPNGGVAIGFDTEKVKKGFLIDITRRVGGRAVENPIRPDPGNQLLPCKYSKPDGSFEQPSTLVEKYFRNNSYSVALKTQDPFGLDTLLACLSADVYQSISTIKHGAYRHEEEWRCVNRSPNPIEYPVHLNEANRYFIELPFTAVDYVKEVWLSPHGDTIGARNAAEHLKERLDLQYEIKTSTIPYRT